MAFKLPWRMTNMNNALAQTAEGGIWGLSRVSRKVPSDALKSKPLSM